MNGKMSAADFEALHNDEGFPDLDPDRPSNGKKEKEESLAALIIKLVLPHVELFHDPKLIAYALVTDGTKRVAIMVRSRAMKTWIGFIVRELGPISVKALEEAIALLESLAIHDNEERLVHLRVAEVEGAIYIDLGDDTGRVVEVTHNGWRLLDVAPVMFRRVDAMRPLPTPKRGGKVEELRPFLNVDDHGFVLSVAWLVAAYRPGRPFTILAAHGEQGTAKSTYTRVLRDLVDPNAVPVRSPPKSEDDLIISASHSHVVAFDNLSGVQPWLSDALCRLATGGGLSKRSLYTDGEEFVIEVLRPCAVNGIDELANRADLAERAIVLELQPLPAGKRKSERAFREAFAEAAPSIFGALLDGVSAAVKNIGGIVEADLPRMADFAMWAAAAESGLGFAPGTIAEAYKRNRQRAVDLALEASPVAVALREFLRKPMQAGRWEGQPEQLLSALSELTAEPTRRMPSWPKNGAALSRSLRRAATFLRTVGFEIDFDGKDGSGAAKSRQWTVKASAEALGRDQGRSGTQLDPSRSTEETSAGDARDARDAVSPTSHPFSGLLS